MKKDATLLFFLLCIAAFLTFLPHANYNFPLHVDEWVHLQFAENLTGNPLYFQENELNLEKGFHIILSVINSFGIDYMLIFRFLPSLFSVFICLSLFILSRIMFGKISGFFSVIFFLALKSSDFLLGPIFLVPMSLGLFFILSGIFLLKKNSPSAILASAALFIIHPPSALVFSSLSLIFLFTEKKIKNFLFVILGFFISFPLYSGIFLSKGIGTLNSLSFVPMPGFLFIPRFISYFLMIFILLGIFFSVLKKNYFLLLSSVFLLFFIFIFYRFEVEFFIPYRRAIYYLLLVFTLCFGFGVSESLEKLKGRRKIFLLALILIFIFAFSIPQRIQSEKYVYRIINESEYSDFLWIRENAGNNSLAVLDPWKANAFTPVAGISVYSRIVQAPSEKYESRNLEIERFFSANCTGLDFLRKNNVSIIYGNCNSSLKKIHDYVFVFNNFSA